MQWVQFVLFFIGIFALWLWNRAKNTNDMRHMETQLRAYAELMRAVHIEILMEMKDFHGRICILEERNRK